MKASLIFKTKKEYKIITMYKTDTGSYKLLDPVFICPIETEIEILGDKIFESLNHSKLIVNPNISYHKELLKKISERSYDNLYKNSKSCMLFWENDSFVIEPQAYSIKWKSLEPIADKIVTITNVTKPIVLEEIVKVLNE